ncbi:MAG: cache domain-containing protein [Candidatus Dadabacteria bacterium]|nr:cache domain-containing protein [Candidatus Dadabacteria bacterium]
MKNLIFLFCVIGLLGAVSCDWNNGDADPVTAVSGISDEETLEEFVRYAASRLSEATTFSETLGILNGFRDESGDWNDGSTYLVLLTSGGGVYVHARNRDIEDQDWSQLEDDVGNNVGQQLLSGGLVTYVGNDGIEKKAYALPFSASAVPFANPRSSQEDGFVLVGGFDYEPEVIGQKKSYEDLIESIPVERRPHPSKEAWQIGNAEKDDDEKKTEEERREELKTFVEEAIIFFTWAIAVPDLDPVRLRTIFRLDRGPWRHVSTYIYIMDGEGNVIFNGANRNIEQTNLRSDPDVGEDIARLIDAANMPGGGFVSYNWEDPAVVGDGEQSGGPGGDSPKLGYTKAHSSDKDNPDASVYIFGSGLYLGSSEQ